MTELLDKYKKGCGGMKYTSGKIAELISAILGNEFDKDKNISYVLSDSRKIQGEGMLFVALRGDRFDGHSFVSDITKDGKHFALIEDENYISRNTLFVPDVRKAMYDLALFHRENALSKQKCVAITGSVGKTSTKEYVSSVFSEKFKVYKSPGNQNSYTGLPMVILNCDENAEYMVLEAGMNTAGEISKISKLIKPHIAIITNIGWSHSEYLGGRDKIFKEKTDITVGMNDGILVVNGDDDYLSGDINRDCEVVRCSVENKKCEFYCSNIESKDGLLCFNINGKDAFIRQIGIHNVKNSLLAYAAGIKSGLSHDEAAAGISALSPNESRIKIYSGKNGCEIIEDCYNAAPESMKAALDYLKTRKGKRIAVLGDMLELGGFAEKLHKNVGEHSAGCCDILFCYGELGKYIAEGAKAAGCKEVYYFPMDKREELVSSIEKITKENVSLLFKASNRMRFGDIIKSANLI